MRVVNLFGVEVWYVEGRGVLGAEIVRTEPSLESLSLTRLNELRVKLIRKDFIRGAIIHGINNVAGKLSSLIEEEIRGRVGSGFLKALERLRTLSITSDNPEEVKEAIEEVLREYRKIPVRYLPLFRFIINYTVNVVKRDADYRRGIAMRCFDSQVERVRREVEKYPRIADYILTVFLENLNHKVHQRTYNELEISDYLSKFAKVMQVLEKGAITIRIKVTPEIAEEVMEGNFAGITKIVEQKLREGFGL